MGRSSGRSRSLSPRRRRRSSIESVQKGAPWSHQFADETGIHGVAPMVKAKSKTPEKIIWTAVVVTALIAVVVGVTKIFLEYLHQDVSTKLSFIEVSSFPSFMLCTPYWVNESKASKLGMNVDDYRFLGTLTPIPQFFGWSETTPGGKGDEFLEKFGKWQVDALMQAISIDTDIVKLVDVNNFLVLQDIDTTLALTQHNGVCVRFNSSYKMPFSTGGQKVEIHLMIPPLAPPYGIKQSAGPPSYYELFAGDEVLTPFPRTGTRVATGKSVDIAIKVTQLKLEPKRLGGCNAQSTVGDKNACQQQASNEFCSKFGRVKMWYPGWNQTVKDVFGQECNYMEIKDDKGQDIIIYVANQCKTPCRQTLLDFSSSPLGDDPDGTTNVLIRLDHHKASREIVESFSISLFGFISNVGGQVSLYTGASLITIIHVFMFCAFKRNYG